MLSMRNLQSAAQAAHYFAKDDYYMGRGHHEPSAWWGRGARTLGLSGAVDREVFEAALSGVLPGSLELPRRADDLRRPGLDLTFSAPKSVSLLALVAGDRAVVEAHAAAVSAALTYLEREAAQARSTVASETVFEPTRNLLMARFDHDTSRALDPQLHTHAVVINATQRVDGAWRALSNERLYQTKMLGGAIYRAELAMQLERLGYAVERTHADGRFEVRGFSQGDLDAFSQRRQAIERALAEVGYSSARAAEVAALDTREAKRAVDREALVGHWQAAARERGLVFPDPVPRERSLEREQASAAHAVDVAIRHLAERDAVFSEARLLATALAEAVGGASFPEVQAAITARVGQGDLVVARLERAPGERAYTTREGVQLERGLLAMLKLGCGQVDPILAPRQAHAVLERTRLTAGQAEAVARSLTTADRVAGIQGYAGTGKTTALGLIRTAAERAGYEVRGFAVSAAAALVLEAEARIPSQTLASHLLEQARGEGKSGRQALWVVDEASFIGNREAFQLLRAAERASARVLLVGDRDQLPSIEAGRAFALLSDHGMSVAVMDEVLRQKAPELKQAVCETIERRPHSALARLESAVKTVATRDAQLDAVAADFLGRDLVTRGSTLVVTGANADRRDLNERIRLGLRAEGRLLGQDHAATILVSRGFTDAQLREAAHYAAGDVVRMTRNYKRLGLAKGEYLAVRGIDAATNTVHLEAGDGRAVAWRPHRAGHVEVYAAEGRALAAGDQLRWTRNDEQKQRRNGETVRVVGVEAGRATVQRGDGKREAIDLAADRHWDHAYVSTVHAAQGRTADHVIIHLDTEKRELVGHESWYVALSRARHSARIYTDDEHRLPAAISRSLEKASALESVELGRRGPTLQLERAPPRVR